MESKSSGVSAPHHSRNNEISSGNMYQSMNLRNSETIKEELCTDSDVDDYWEHTTNLMEISKTEYISNEDTAKKAIRLEYKSNTSEKQELVKNETNKSALEQELKYKLAVKKPLLIDKKCAVCNKTFNFQRDLIQHVRLYHHYGKAFKCKNCEARYHNIKSISAHRRKFHKKLPKKHNCEICLELFSSEKDLEKHSKVYSDSWTNEQNKPNTNQKKSKSSDKDKLKKQHICEICSKSFTHIGHYRRHLSLHAKSSNKEGSVEKTTKKRACQYCSKIFGFLADLNRHLRIHTGEQPFSCSLCEKSYKRKDNLKIHQKLVHSNCSTDFKCQYCTLGFSNLKLLLNHLKTHRDLLKQYDCEYCSKNFVTMGSLKRHITKKHLEQCPSSMRGKSSKIMEEDENFKCQSCGGLFKDEESLSHHMQTHEDLPKNYVCKFCSKSFHRHGYLQQHVRIHTIGRPFFCSLCQKNFHRRNDLIRHQTSQNHLEQKKEQQKDSSNCNETSEKTIIDAESSDVDISDADLDVDEINEQVSLKERQAYFKTSHCNRSNKSSLLTSRSSSSSRYSLFSEECDNSLSKGSMKDDSGIHDINTEISKHSSASTTKFNPQTHNIVSDAEPGVSTFNLATTLTDSKPDTSDDVSLTLKSPLIKGRNRLKQPEKWGKNVLKIKRNSGKDYETHTMSKNVRVARQVKTPCTETCRLKCYKNFSEDDRKQLFASYWELGDIEKQRQFMVNCMQIIEPKFRCMRVGGSRNPRQNNNAFFFPQGDNVVRVCKLFFKNTLDINDRPIRTVLKKRQNLADHILEPDQRGKHGNHKKLDLNLETGVKQFIDQIPKIKSHFTRVSPSKTLIDGSKTISSIYRDYVDRCKEKNEPFSTYIYFYRTFTEDFTISFFVPKKDCCEQCTDYSNMDEVEKIQKKVLYESHLHENKLIRDEKIKDKENVNGNTFVAVYDLRADMQLPKGEGSEFYYEAKLNVFNFTIYDIKTNKCQCFVWDEANGNGGVNELGTCILQYIKKLSNTDGAEIIFYSDNYVGQQNNKFMIALYLYAVRYLNIQSITHKYLLKGHTQNESDSVHSLIERETKRMLKSGPIYTTETFVSIIRSAKKTGKRINVKELCCEDFFNLQILENDIGPLNMTELKLSQVKILRVQRESPNSVFYKSSYTEEEFKEVTVIEKMKHATSISLSKAFRNKPGKGAIIAADDLELDFEDINEHGEISLEESGNLQNINYIKEEPQINLSNCNEISERAMITDDGFDYDVQEHDQVSEESQNLQNTDHIKEEHQSLLSSCCDEELSFDESRNLQNDHLIKEELYTDIEYIDDVKPENLIEITKTEYISENEVIERIPTYNDVKHEDISMEETNFNHSSRKSTITDDKSAVCNKNFANGTQKNFHRRNDETSQNHLQEKKEQQKDSSNCSETSEKTIIDADAESSDADISDDDLDELDVDEINEYAQVSLEERRILQTADYSAYFKTSHYNRSNKSSLSTSRSSSSSRYSLFSEECDNSISKDSMKDDRGIHDINTEISKHSSASTTKFSPQTANIVSDAEPGVSTFDLATTLSDPKPDSSDDVSLTLKSPLIKGRNRLKQPEKWGKNVLKIKRNSGKDYETHTMSKNVRVARQVKTPCTETCRLKCYKNFSEDDRKQLFASYWELGDIEKQRQFMANCMQIIEPKFRCMRVGGSRNPRQNNNAFFFPQGDNVVRVCKLFFKNTLDINDRPIRTVLKKRQNLADHILEPDQRGKHGNHKKVDLNLETGVKQFIDKIPKIKSHFTRVSPTKTLIDGSKTISSIYRDYVDRCKEKNEPFSTYIYFYRTFTEDFTISFFVPKKDCCEQCTDYSNMDEVEKIQKKVLYENHLHENKLIRDEKIKDKETVNGNTFVAVYDLRADMQLPKGEGSEFYYEAKLNVFNFTIYDIKTNKCQCFVWDEANGNGGVNELGTCVLQYIKKLSNTDGAEIIFYSDNYAGQQNNKFMIALYLYAVRYLNIKSITHKYLLKGHTQNESDSVHSLIERETKRMLKSGPIYTTETFVSIIRSAKKTGKRINVKELCCEDFFNLQILENDIGPLNMTELKLSQVKILRVQRESPNSVFYKSSYTEEQFKEVTVIEKMKYATSISLSKAFHNKPGKGAIIAADDLELDFEDINEHGEISLEESGNLQNINYIKEEPQINLSNCNEISERAMITDDGFDYDVQEHDQVSLKESQNVQNTDPIKEEHQSLLSSCGDEVLSFDESRNLQNDHLIKEELYTDIEYIDDVKPENLIEITKTEYISENEVIERIPSSNDVKHEHISMEETNFNHSSRYGKSTITDDKCAVCNKKFLRQMDLVRHARQFHPKSKAIKCIYCNAAYTNLESVSVHMRIHRNEPKKHPCEFCTKRFSTFSKLKIHLRVHTKERPFPCSLCEKSFKYAMDLKKHKNNIHLESESSETKEIVCEFCSKIFLHSYQLKNHLRKHTGERSLSCSLCEKSFKHKISLQKHQNTHVESESQSIIYLKSSSKTDRSLDPQTNESELNNSNKDSSPQYNCEFCSQSFDLLSHFKCHLRVHSGKRQYTCLREIS